MGQKVNPISVRLEQTNRQFDSCWYGDYQYSYLLNQDLKVKSYINNILKLMGCPESHISIIYMAKKIKILFCYLDPRRATYLKSSRFYLKVAKKNSNKFKRKQRKQYFIKNKLVARYLLRKNKRSIASTEIKYDGRLPFLSKKKAVPRLAQVGNLMGKNLAHYDIGGTIKTYSQKGKKKPFPISSLDKNAGKLRFAKKSFESDGAVLPSQPVPYSPLVTRKNPFRILLAFYKKKKKRKKKFKKRFPVAVTMGSSNRINNRASSAFFESSEARFARRRPLKKRKEVYALRGKSGWRQVAFWRYLTNFSISPVGGEKKKNYDVFSATWSYLFFNHKIFFNKVIQKKKGFQTWHKSLFIRYLLLFIYKKRFKFCASTLNSYMGSQIFRLATRRTKISNFYPSSEADADANINVKQRTKKDIIKPYLQSNVPFLNSQSLDSRSVRKIGLTIEAERIIVANKNVKCGLLKYQMVLESLNKIEWFQGRGISFLWFIFNSVHPSQKRFKTESAVANSNRKLFFPESREGLHPLLAASRKRKDNIKLYTHPHRITPSQIMIVNKIKNFQLSNKIKLGEKRKKNLPSSILTENGNFFKLSAFPSQKESSRAEKIKIPSLRLPKKQILFSSKGDEKKRGETTTFNHFPRFDSSTPSSLPQTDSFVALNTLIPRKPLYPRTVKSKGFLSYIEYILSSQLNSNVRLFSWKTKDEMKSALFIVEQIVYFLQKRVPFSRIKQQMSRELKLGSMRGIRITYSGRLGGRSKKAQRSRQKTFQWGQTSSHVFASKLSFACKHALTIFGKIGIKVWVCYR